MDKKQNHFMNKEFDRAYLERVIICSKGSIETAKSRLDKLCTARTMLSEYFKEPDEERNINNISDYAVMPNLTAEGYRIFIYRVRENSVVTANTFIDMMVESIFDSEYLMKNDYCTGLIGVFDLRTLNIMDVITKVDFSLLHKAMTVAREGYEFRVKALHFISDSKFLENFIRMLSSAFPTKIAKRFHAHKTNDTVYDCIPKELLSEDYGGNAPPLVKLNDIRFKEVHSEEFLQHMKKMNQTRTDESKRIGGKPDLDFLDGTFRNLTVD